jgi:hypothetical protein
MDTDLAQTATKVYKPENKFERKILGASQGILAGVICGQPVLASEHLSPNHAPAYGKGWKIILALSAFSTVLSPAYGLLHITPIQLCSDL